MSSVKEEEVTEPDLVYFKAVPKLEPVKSESLLMSNYALRKPPHESCPPLPPRFHPFLQSQVVLTQPPPQPAGSSYPFTSSTLPLQYPQHQQQRGAGDFLHLYPTSDGFQSLMATDSIFQEEVTLAAKTLFSKRNRTLLHWLYPGVSKGQLKIDVNAAWNSLPERERLFYISQVLGKFAPHTTSLMVNPQLEPNSQALNSESNFVTTDSQVLKSKQKNNKKNQKVTEKRNIILLSDEDISCDSGLVVDIDAPKTKRKYTRRKTREKLMKLDNEPESVSATTETTEDKAKLSEEQKTAVLTSQPECTSEVQDVPQNEAQTDNPRKRFKKQLDDCAIPRVKRKYVKRKLVRKKYTRKKPLENSLGNVATETEDNSEKGSESITPQGNHCDEDIDIWVDLDDDLGIQDFNLLNEEVDSFWDRIDDPDSLFMELEIE